MDFNNCNEVLEHISNYSVLSTDIIPDKPIQHVFSEDTINIIFNLILKGEGQYNILDIGCRNGSSTSEIFNQINNRQITDFKIFASDVNKKNIEACTQLFSNKNNIVLQQKTGSDFSNIADNSIDGIFSLNGMIPLLNSYYDEFKDISPLESFLLESARVLKINKPLVLTYLDHNIVMVKDLNIWRTIKLRIIHHTNHQSLNTFFKSFDFVRPINDLDYIDELINNGYTIRKNKDPRNDPVKHLHTFKKFIERGKEFASEEWLTEMDYQFVEPNTFTMGHRIAYKIINDFPDERFNSNFSLIKGDKEFPLYLQKELPKL